MKLGNVLLAILLLLSVPLFGQDKNPPKEGIPCGCIAYAPFPVYPEVALMAKYEGKVVLDVDVNEKGEVTEVKIVEGARIFHEELKDKFKQWRFASGNQMCRFTVFFKIRSKEDPHSPHVVFNEKGEIVIREEPPKPTVLE